MSNGYRNQPISGFTGYIPGAKWQVGSRYIPPSYARNNNGKTEKISEKLRNIEGQATSSTDNSLIKTKFDIPTRNYSEMTGDELREHLNKMQMDMQQLQLALEQQRAKSTIIDGDIESAAIEKTTQRDDQFERDSQTIKQRSRSVPRRIENNPFEGVESGWWSKGEVQRNKERREIANGGHQVSGGNWQQRPPSRRQSRKTEFLMKDIENDIPAAGYSGHIQGLRHLGVGKSFNTAARQARKEYLERRRTYSGSRELLNNRVKNVQYSDEELLANAIKLPDNRF